MDTQHLIAIELLAVAVLVCAVATSISTRARDLAFFFLVTGAVLAERMDVNFFTRYWYRGTTRGIEISLIDAIALGLLVGMVFTTRTQRRWFFPAGIGFLLLYFGYAAFSVTISEPRLFGLFELSKIARGIVIFLVAAFYVRGTRELGIFVTALGCAVGFESAMALKQRLFNGEFRPGGTLDHANSLSMFLCLTGPVFVAAVASSLPRWLRIFSWACLGFATIGILLTVSRAGVPIFALIILGATVFCMSRKVTWGKAGAAAALLAVIFVLVALSWNQLMSRYASASLEEEYLDTRSEGRGYYLRLAGAILDDHHFGVGLNNWSYAVSKTYGNRFGAPYEDYDSLYFEPDAQTVRSFRFAAPAHSLAALTAGELGWPGLAIFMLLWMRWLQLGVVFLWRYSADPMRQLAVGCFFGICGLMLQSITEWTYRQTPILFTAHILLGVLASLYYERRRRRNAPPENSLELEVEEQELADFAVPARGL